MRFSILGILIVLAIAGLAAGAAGFWYGWIALAAAGPLALLGLYDLRQTQHSLLRNYPVIAHMRWLFEGIRPERSEEHTSELQSLMRISYAVFCLKKKKT